MKKGQQLLQLQLCHSILVVAHYLLFPVFKNLFPEFCFMMKELFFPPLLCLQFSLLHFFLQSLLFLHLIPPLLLQFYLPLNQIIGHLNSLQIAWENWAHFPVSHFWLYESMLICANRNEFECTVVNGRDPV